MSFFRIVDKSFKVFQPAFCDFCRRINLNINFQMVFILHDLIQISNGWIDDLRFKVIFNSISVLLGRLEGDNERLCAIKPRLRLERLPPRAGLEPGTA